MLDPTHCADFTNLTDVNWDYLSSLPYPILRKEEGRMKGMNEKERRI